MDEECNIKLNLNLTKYRFDNDLSLKQLSRLTGLSEGYLSQIERGKMPSFDAIKKIADGLGICPLSLLNCDRECDRVK